MKCISTCIIKAVFGFVLALCAASQSAIGQVSPLEDGENSRTRWEHRNESQIWTRDAIDALKNHGAVLVQSVPGDIADWCPGYAASDAPDRRAFWVGFLSALAKHESTYRPNAVGGGGKWYGLLQIAPGTARGYKCRARSGEALKDGSANLSCGIRIMASTVLRDGVISRGMRGVAADWGPFHSQRKRTDMMNWTRAQSYCQIKASPRPKARASFKPRENGK